MMKLTPIFPIGDDLYAGGRKRIFIGLLIAACVFLSILFLFLLILPWLGHGAFLKYASTFAGVAGIAVLAWVCLTLVLHIHTGRQLPGIFFIRHVIIRLLLPLMEILGKFLGIDKKIVRRSFIKVNNDLVLKNFSPVKPADILLLLPHCIQASTCPRRLTYSLDNCAHCGNCQIGELEKMATEYGFHIAVATGGTVARRIVVECKPRCIIAVACERDLTSGIQDSYPIPVYGVLNERPKGPCMDTLVPLDPLHEALSFFIGGDMRQFWKISGRVSPLEN